jgi:hypothetical protein
MHDSGWLIFKFTSELDMLAVLNGGPYHVFGRLLILKHMPDYFDFDTAAMIRLPVWVKFPNLPLQCWSPLCLSKLASVIGKPVHADLIKKKKEQREVKYERESRERCSPPLWR